MARRNKISDQKLKEALARVGAAADALQSAAHVKTGGAARANDPTNTPWLSAFPALVVFRTQGSARLGSDLVLEAGYSSTHYDRYVPVEAPWLFVSALVARLGLATEVLGIHLDSGAPSLPALRLLD